MRISSRRAGEEIGGDVGGGSKRYQYHLIISF
jgi:hypothetical protein